VYRVLSLLGISVLTLLAIGFVTLASAGSGNGVRLYGEGHEAYFVIHQAVWFGLSLFFLAISAFLDYHKWREYPWLTWLAYVVVLGLMGAVFFFPEVKGSRRWVNLGPVRLQPSEFAKIVVVFVTAMFLDRSGWRIERFLKGAVPAVGLVVVPVGLALAEPDFGAAMVILLTGGVLFFISGMRFIHMGIMGVTALLGIGFLVALTPNRMNRIMAWLPDWLSQALGVSPDVMASQAENSAAHQLNMALVAIRNGGTTGAPGLFQSRQKLAYLPEAHTDFIFAIGAEEWGLIFSIGLLLLFIAFFVCGIIISARAPDRFGRLLAYGMSFIVFFQALFNMSVVSGLAPTKGIALPFISYGGTNLLTAMVAVGILFNVGRQMELPKRRPRCTLSRVCPNQEES